MTFRLSTYPGCRELESSRNQYSQPVVSLTALPWRGIPFHDLGRSQHTEHLDSRTPHPCEAIKLFLGSNTLVPSTKPNLIPRNRRHLAMSELRLEFIRNGGESAWLNRKGRITTARLMTFFLLSRKRYRAILGPCPSPCTRSYKTFDLDCVTVVDADPNEPVGPLTSASSEQGTMHSRVQRVIDHIEANLHRKLVLPDLARLVKLSRSRLCQEFKAEMGVPVGQYIKALKMQNACELLASTSLSVKEIGAAVGMRDQSHFSRDFKRTYDLTPLQYRAHFSRNDRKN